MGYLRISFIFIILTGLSYVAPTYTALGPKAAYAEDLPWGKTREPKLITPDSRSYEDTNEDRQRSNPLPSESNRDRYREDSRSNSNQRAYQPERSREYRRYNNEEREPRRREHSSYDDRENETYSDSEILNTGHRFFGKVSKGLAKVIAYAFSEAGRPNGYILGEEAGGAFFAGLKYGEGTLVTKYDGRHKVYWQGPSIGYDFGAEGSKTMILVYDLRNPDEIYQNFAGVNGSAYLVGGIGLTFQRRGHIVLARIQSGLGVRLGANVGYLKYTRRPTWNPF